MNLETFLGSYGVLLSNIKWSYRTPGLKITRIVEESAVVYHFFLNNILVGEHSLRGFAYPTANKTIHYEKFLVRFDHDMRSFPQDAPHFEINFFDKNGLRVSLFFPDSVPKKNELKFWVAETFLDRGLPAQKFYIPLFDVLRRNEKKIINQNYGRLK